MADRQQGNALVCIVDDDVSFREAIEGLVSSFGFSTRSFGSAQDFLRDHQATDARCLILDIKMPGMTGLELYGRLLEAGEPPPTIFISSVDDAGTRSKAMKAGAVGFFGKPFDRDALMATLHTVVEPMAGC